MMVSMIMGVSGMVVCAMEIDSVEWMGWKMPMLCRHLVLCLDESVHSPLPPPVHLSMEENVKSVSLLEEDECM